MLFTRSININMTERFPLSITEELFAYRPGTPALAGALHGLNYLRGVLPDSMPLALVLSHKRIDPGSVAASEKELAHNIARIYGHETMDPVPFILSQLKAANRVVDSVACQLSIPGGKLNDEVSIEDPLLLRSMARYLRGKKGERKISDKLSFELRRQLPLAIISGRLYMSTANNRPRELISELQITFNQDFYSDSKVGSSTPKTFITTHNPQTNEVTNYREGKREWELLQNEKLASFLFRHVIMDGGREIEVYTSDRKKDDTAAIIKSIAQVKNGTIDPTEQVKDTMGKEFVVNGDNNLRDEFMKLYLQKITENYPNARIVPHGPRKEVLSGVAADRGQSTKVSYNRVLIYFDGLTMPYEVICYGMQDFLNSKVDVGKVDNNGLYDGYAHTLFQLRRVLRVGEILFPIELYNYNIDNLMRNAMKRRVDDLMEAREIEY